MRRLAKDTKISLLARVPLFAHCSKREFVAISAAADEITVGAGTEVTREGDPGREFVVLVDGRADVHQDGRKINDLGPGDYVGEIALLTGSPRTATVRASEPCRLLVLSDRAFRQVVREVPSIQHKLILALAERLAPNAL